MSAVIESMTDGLTLVDGSGKVLMRNTAGASIAHAKSGSDTRVSQYVMTDTSGRELSHDELPQIRIFASEEDVITQDVVLRFVDRSPSRTLSISVRKLPASDGGAPDRAVLVYHDVTADRAQRSALESFAGRGRARPARAAQRHRRVGRDADRRARAVRAALAATRRRPSWPASARRPAACSSSSRTCWPPRPRGARSCTPPASTWTRWLGRVATERGEMTTGVPPRIEVDPLPAVHADEAMVRQLLNNLIGNAIKYVRPGDSPEITVRRASDGGPGRGDRGRPRHRHPRRGSATTSSRPSTAPTGTTGTTGTGSGWPCARTSSSGTAAGSPLWHRWTASASGWSSRCRQPDRG